MLAFQHRGGLLVRGVAARLRLGEAVRPQQLALRERREPAALLLVVPVGQERVADERVVHGSDHAVARAHARQLLDGHDVGEYAQAGSAPLLGHEHAQETQLGHLAENQFKGLLHAPIGILLYFSA